MTSSFTLALQKKLHALHDKQGIYLFVSPFGKYKIMKGMVFCHFARQEHKPCLYVTLNKSYKAILHDLKEQKCHITNIYFIDAVSHAENQTVPENVILISSPHALTELSLAICTAAKTKQFGYLFFDSFDTLLIYNDLKTSQRFSHYIISILRETNIGGILFSLDADGATQLIPVLMQFCDECIHVKETDFKQQRKKR